ncbi:hypothetical protein Droror1_Dr00009447 [Drosera rotundifolia]
MCNETLISLTNRHPNWYSIGLGKGEATNPNCQNCRQNWDQRSPESGDGDGDGEGVPSPGEIVATRRIDEMEEFSQ